MDSIYRESEYKMTQKIINVLHADKDIDTVFYDSMQKLIRCNYRNYEVTVSVDLCAMSQDVIKLREGKRG